MKKIVVTKIISKTEILLNVGKLDNITEDTNFEIIGMSSPIIDPVTGDDLGCLEYTKAKLIARTVLDKMTICTRQFDINLVLPLQELNVDIDALIDNELDKEIHIGDIARISKDSDTHLQETPQTE